MARNPYFIDEPCVISFSGGRTSAYMLAQILKAHGGTLPPDHHVIFANTGKEVEATLNFVDQLSKELSVSITWLEYAEKKTFKVVDYKIASRNGEPFEQLITDRKFLPNPSMRFCTGEMKVLTIDRYIKSIGVNDYLTVVGIRADEPRRIVKMRIKDYHMPLADAGVKVQDIHVFWDSMPFNLETPSPSHSNCDLCMLKGHGIKLSLIRDGIDPQWWIDQEERIGGFFRKDAPSYKQMAQYSKDQGEMFDFDDESISCFCGD